MAATGNAAEKRAGTPSHALEYTRRLYEEVLAWYNVAETKAQVILALDGILLGTFAGLTLTSAK